MDMSQTKEIENSKSERRKVRSLIETVYLKKKINNNILLNNMAKCLGKKYMARTSNETDH